MEKEGCGVVLVAEGKRFLLFSGSESMNRKATGKKHKRHKYTEEGDIKASAKCCPVKCIPKC